MKSIYLFLFLLFSSFCYGQKLQAEAMVGVTGYNGDLTEKEISFKRMRPAASLKLIYNTGDFINLRLGVMYGKIMGDDKTNKNMDLKNRNLSFQTNILEVSLCTEFNLFDPHIYVSYPYLFTGIGFFSFDPYAFDNSNQKTYLHPLSTEGQGLKEYPDKKNYSLTQFCMPVGLGWRIKLKKCEVGYEFGYRVLFTDYIDDVSKTYVSLETLALSKGPKATEMSFRGLGGWSPDVGGIRGNSKKRDTYFFSGLRFVVPLSKSAKKKSNSKSEDGKTEKK